MTAYYNEIDPYAAQWLRNLIDGGHIAKGHVDERSIVDVSPDDLAGYHQCHFFAGIGGWSLALRLAGVEDATPVWTGSPPCQDVSVAGAPWKVRRGLSGPRSGLVRPWLSLVERLRPGALYFENVHGIKKWVAEIKNRLAAAGYSLSESEQTAADIAGPHLRRRMWLAAHRDREGQQESGGPQPCAGIIGDPWRTAPGDVWTPAPDRAVGMADGFPARVAAIRAFGNAIVPQVAAEFIAANRMTASLPSTGSTP